MNCCGNLKKVFGCGSDRIRYDWYIPFDRMGSTDTADLESGTTTFS